MTRKALNRALLARQLLLQREMRPVLGVLEQLAGLQAQQARPPFVGLWSRIDGFRREDFLSLLASRKAVRATMMRGTLHSLSANDYSTFRATLQPMLTASAKSILRDRMNGLDVKGVVETAREVFQGGPRTFTDLRDALMKAYPQGDERAMGYVVRTHLPLACAVDDSPWGFKADPRFELAAKCSEKDEPEKLVMRYLGAFGPATAADVQAWSGMAGMQAVVEKLRPKLFVSRDERRRELFDLPRAPRPEESVEAPPRFVAPFDNLILGHADRTRVVPEEHRARLVTKNLLVPGTILVDGFVAGTWAIEVARKKAALSVTPFAKLSKVVQATLAAEGEQLARFLEPDASAWNVNFEKP